MKNLLLLMLTVGVLSSSCKKEEDPLPVGFTITKIEVTAFPGFNASGQRWDTFTSWPDLFVGAAQLTTGQNYTTAYYDECMPGTLYEFSNLSFTYSSISAQVSLSLYDYDSGSTENDYIGGLTFHPQSFVDRSSFDVTLSGYNVAFRVHTSWIYN